MIVAIGADLVETGRIGAIQQRHPRFASRILSEAELTEWQRRGHPVSYLARRWAAKEAVLKALGSGLRGPLSFRQIEILNDPLGAPTVRLTGACAELAQRRGIVRWHVSLTDERTHALAFVVAEGA